MVLYLNEKGSTYGIVTDISGNVSGRVPEKKVIRQINYSNIYKYPVHI